MMIRWRPRPSRLWRKASTAALRLYASDASEAERAAIRRRITHEPGFEKHFMAAHQVLGAVDQWEKQLRADPDILEALDAPAPRPKVRRHAATQWAAGLAVFALAVVAVMLWLSLGDAPDPAANRYITRVGQQSDIVLPDGSAVTLNTDSELVSVFTSDVRRVTLQRGEAYFTVAQDTTRPFSIELQGLALTVRGTEFNLRRLAGGFQLALIEGSVSIARQDTEPAPDAPAAMPLGAEVLELDVQAPWRMLAGTSLTFDVHRQRARVRNDPDIRSAQRWRRGIVSFRDQALREVVAELNRYSSKAILIEDPDFGERLVLSTTLRVMPVRDGLAHLENSYPIRLLPLADRILLLEDTRE